MADTPRSASEWQALAEEADLVADSIVADAIDGGLESFRKWNDDDASETMRVIPASMMTAALCTHRELGMRLAFWLVKTGRVSL